MRCASFLMLSTEAPIASVQCAVEPGPAPSESFLYDTAQPLSALMQHNQSVKSQVLRHTLRITLHTLLPCRPGVQPRVARIWEKVSVVPDPRAVPRCRRRRPSTPRGPGRTDGEQESETESGAICASTGAAFKALRAQAGGGTDWPALASRAATAAVSNADLLQGTHDVRLFDGIHHGGHRGHSGEAASHSPRTIDHA